MIHLSGVIVFVVDKYVVDACVVDTMRLTLAIAWVGADWHRRDGITSGRLGAINLCRIVSFLHLLELIWKTEAD